MDHSQHVRLMDSELTDANLSGATLYGPDDENIGQISEVHGAGMTAHVVVDVGGFLGIGAKPVAINVVDIDFMRDSAGTVHGRTGWTTEDLENLPEHLGDHD